MKNQQIGFIGLGSMGEPMARNLLAAGYALKVFNRTAARAKPLASLGATTAATPREVADAGGIVVSMLANDTALKTVTLGTEGFLPALGAGGLHISMSTVSPETSRLLAAAHAKQGSLFLSAPVFGRPEAATAQKLWICQSGSAEAKQRARPVLEALSQGIQDFGEDAGAANVVKLAGNFLILSAIGALSEALSLAEKNAVDRGALAAFFGQTIFACPVYQNYGRILAQRIFEPAGFKLELGMKDVRLVREVAEHAQVPMPMADLLHARLLSSLARGRAQMDWTAIELTVAEAAGLN
ncbi:MAG: NAD(P)-dependent oxidoreductase [Gammaproteobacteria bacterium]